MSEEHTHDENCNHDGEGTPFEMAPPELQVAHLTMGLMELIKQGAEMVRMIETITGIAEQALSDNQTTLDNYTPEEEE